MKEVQELPAADSAPDPPLKHSAGPWDLSRKPALLLLSLILLFRILTGFNGLASVYPWSDENDTYRCINPVLTEEQGNVSWLKALKRIVYARPYDGREDPDNLQKNYQPHVLYHLIAKGFSCLLGPSVFAMRLPAALLGLGCILAVYQLGGLLFGRWVGLLAAAYLAFHPEHLCYSQEARGYIGVVFLQLNASTALWKSLSKFSLWQAACSALCFCLSFLMHPVAALTIPGYGFFLVLLLLFSLIPKGESSWSGMKVMDLLKTGSVLAVIGLALILLVQTVLGGVVLVSTFNSRPENQPSVFGSGQWEGYLAPLFCTYYHVGFVLYFGITLVVLGTFLSSRLQIVRTLFVFLPALSPLAYFALTDPLQLPQRYLTPSIAFLALLVARGMVILPASLLAPLRGWRWTRISIQAVSVLLMSAMASECWGPYRYEYTFGSQRPTVLLSRIVQTPPFDKDLFAFLPYEPYVWGHLKAYGVDMNRYVKGSHIEADLASNVLEAATSAITHQKGAWFVFTETTIQNRIGPTLLKMGFKAFACVGYPLYIYRPGFRGSPQEQAASLSEVIEFVEKTERPGYGFFLPAARYLREVGEASKADSVLDSAIAETELKARTDPSRDQWALEALVQSLCEEKRFDEAAKWLLLYCSLPPYDLGKFVSWLTKDEETRTALLASSNFDFASFLSSYRRTMEKDFSHDDAFKQYWTQWFARKNLQEGKYDNSLAFAQIALDFAQSDLEKILELMEECELAREKQASAGDREGRDGATSSESGSPP